MGYNAGSILIIANAFTLCAGEEMHIPLLGVVALAPPFYKFMDPPSLPPMASKSLFTWPNGLISGG